LAQVFVVEFQQQRLAMACLGDSTQNDKDKDRETRKLKSQLSGVSWEELADLDSVLEVAQAYLGKTHDGEEFDSEFNGILQRGLRKAVSALSHRIKVVPSQLKQLEPRLSELKERKKRLMSEEALALKNMAAAQLRRVGAPEEIVNAVMFGGVCDKGLLLDIVESGAGAETFNTLCVAMREANSSLPDWVCSLAASKRPETDLLGMCPGGKPHLSEAQLGEIKASRCRCQICEFVVKLRDISKQIGELQQEVDAFRTEISLCNAHRRFARKLLQHFRSSSVGTPFEEDEPENDPVFASALSFEADDDGALMKHRQAQDEWGKLENTLTLADLPLRIVFLDKSGSMGGDVITYEALLIALHNSLHPTHGSTLTILFAAPGETQIVLRRPSDAPVEISVGLGSATWFNEPVLRTLRFLAPLVEKLDMQSWLKEFGQPPLQVLCMTDGFDNCSASHVRTLHGLVRELKQISGPVTQKKIYLPIVGRAQRHLALLEADSPQVPVWLTWIATGVGGSTLLNGKLPKEVCLVDAVAAPIFRDALADLPQESARCTQQADMDIQKKHISVQQSTAVSRARYRAHAVSMQSSDVVTSRQHPAVAWGAGSRVQVKTNIPGRVPKAAVVLRVVADAQPSRYELLFDDETTGVVEGAMLVGSPCMPATLLRVRQGASGPRSPQAPHGYLSRTALPSMQRLQVLAVVDALTRDMATTLQSIESTSNLLSLENAVSLISGGEEVLGEVATRLEGNVKSAQSALDVVAQPQLSRSDPSEVLLDVLHVVGSSAANLLPEDRAVAQRFLSAALEIIACGGSVVPEYVGHQLAVVARLAEANTVRRIRLDGEELEKWQTKMAFPLRELLATLLKRGLLETFPTVEGEALLAREDARPCLVAIWRFFDPSLLRSGVEDSLRRAVNRFQRLQPAFSFCASRCSSKEAILSRSGTSICSTSSVDEGEQDPAIKHVHVSDERRSCGAALSGPARMQGMPESSTQTLVSLSVTARDNSCTRPSSRGRHGIRSPPQTRIHLLESLSALPLRVC